MGMVLSLLIVFELPLADSGYLVGLITKKGNAS
jgi:hypothetical protein